MAILKNTTNDVLINFVLKKIPKASPNWLGYDLKIITKKENISKEVMRLYSSGELYLENFVEKEAMAICNGLDEVVRGKTNNYLFEPIDEKDFQLEVVRDGDCFKINLFMDSVLLLDSYLWNFFSAIGLRVYVTKEDLMHFSSELRKEYEALFPQAKLITKNG